MNALNLFFISYYSFLKILFLILIPPFEEKGLPDISDHPNIQTVVMRY